MIIDTSAIVAVIDGETDAEAVARCISSAPRLAISAATLVELTGVLMRYRRPELHAAVDRRLADWGVEVVPFDAEQSRVARQAYRDYGRGSGHPARLNLGDCYSYALAAITGDDLLFVGDDFTHTDVRSALR
ncbi:type II toxin-antitoxin system VapC family toxin [Microbacterium sp. No. 7]|uniref:type II toxin-antitoxin system VapC family toxin n=1 Tax=Microbacterium sp. No. 7 TaxID=1714373 RepID=UPI0006D18529|nr:type II toxin-antitoxin system VapC family toxin [Microbacterium sp. No. 7]ALJ19162.1 ribonuclease [Microbacterium sp. No. 7]